MIITSACRDWLGLNRLEWAEGILIAYVADSGLGIAEPGLGVVEPGLGVARPGLDVVEPGLGVVRPGLGVVEAGAGVVEPGLGVVKPRAGVVHPALRDVGVFFLLSSVKPTTAQHLKRCIPPRRSP